MSDEDTRPKIVGSTSVALSNVNVCDEETNSLLEFLAAVFLVETIH
jgi:hypothetical protein